MSFAEQIEAEYAAKAARPPVAVPVEGDACEVCHRPVTDGSPLVLVQPQMSYWDEEGRTRRFWAHLACHEAAPTAGVPAPPARHHDPIVADLIARVEALEARKK